MSVRFLQRFRSDELIHEPVRLSGAKPEKGKAAENRRQKLASGVQPSHVNSGCIDQPGVVHGFMHDQMSDGRCIRLFNVIDGVNREAVGIDDDFSLLTSLGACHPQP